MISIQALEPPKIAVTLIDQTLTIRPTQQIPYNVEIETPIIRIIGDVEQYDGVTRVTPTRTRQELQTKGLMVNSNITIEPIPNNYGLISWNGSTMTIT